MRERWVTEALRQRIRTEMRQNSLTYRDVARRSNGLVSKGTVETVLNGKTRQIRLSTLEGFATAFDIDVDELIGLTQAVDEPWVFRLPEIYRKVSREDRLKYEAEFIEQIARSLNH